MQGAAAPFERQAFIKLRFVAGNRGLGKAVEAHRDRFVYGPEPWNLPTALHLRQRQMTELVQPGIAHVKYGPGGAARCGIYGSIPPTDSWVSASFASNTEYAGGHRTTLS